MADKKYNFKTGDFVIMHTCIEAEEHKGREWTCKTDSFIDSSGTEVVFLNGHRGYFACAFLKLSRKRPEAIEKMENNRKSKFNNIQETIKNILLTHPNARDDDFALVALYADKNYNGTIPSFTQVLVDMKSRKMPGFESITRLRRKVQEHFPTLRGEDYKRRKGMVETVKQDIKAMAPMVQGGLF